MLATQTCNVKSKSSRAHKPTGFILWEGPSPIDNQPIVAIAVMQSRNTKTGNIIQTFILRSDISPMEANKIGADVSICGSCPSRGTVTLEEDGYHNRSRVCYVEVDKSVMQVWKAYKAGKYAKMDFNDEVHRAAFKGRKLRWGTYGDSAMLPEDILSKTTKLVKGTTGYSHQWNHAVGQSDIAKRLFMASADCKSDAIRLQAEGYRTFRVSSSADDVMEGEVLCLNYSKDKTCAECMLCNGAGGKSKFNVVIPAHGSKWKPAKIAQREVELERASASKRISLV